MTKINNKKILIATICVGIFSILFFFSNKKDIMANEIPANARPISFYGVGATSYNGGSAVIPQSVTNRENLQYVNGSYANEPAVYRSGSPVVVASPPTSENDTECSQTFKGGCGYHSGSYGGGNSYSSGSYSGGSYSAGSYSSGSYGAGSYSSGSYSSAGSYNGGGYSSGSYGSGSYGGGSYSGGSYGGGSYGGGNLAAGVGYSDKPTVMRCEPYLKSYLGCGKGDDPSEVKKLQIFLRDYEKEKIEITGVYDKATENAVRRFQAKYAIDVLKESWGLDCTTGCTYITTVTKINDIVCNTKTDFSKIALPDPRPKFYCKTVIDPVTKEPKPGDCSAEIAAALGKEAGENEKSSNQTASVGSYAGYMKNKTTGFWKNLISR